MELAEKSCVPCKGGILPFTTEQINVYLPKLNSHWKVVGNHHLEREFAFKDFVSGLSFTNYVAEVSEDEGHHPNILLTWGKVTITIYTHKIDGLHESDFILASKCDYIYEELEN